VTVVLLTCAGLRVDILAAFGRAGATTVAADVNPLAPALHRSDHALVAPPYTDPGYIPALRDTIAEHGVDVVLPLTDLDMVVLAKHREALDALLLLPDVETIERTNDKYRNHRYLEEHGIGSPAAWLPAELPDELPFPVLVKPRRGFGSRNINRAEGREELEVALARTPVESYVEAFCSGQEFSIDVFCDLESRCLNAIPRIMIESKGGEMIKGMAIDDPELVELGRRVSETVGVRGPTTVQCFRTAPGRLEVTDVNLRFGGGFPLPLAAGSEYPALALALAGGERPEPRVGSFRAGVLVTRYFSEVCLVENPDGTLSPLPEEGAGLVAESRS
jgi:carbamoyl-phosphate synthase large subunit